MVTTMQRVLIPGTHVSGIDVSADRQSWQRPRAYVRLLNDFPTVDATGVAAGGCRTSAATPPGRSARPTHLTGSVALFLLSPPIRR